VPGVLTIIGRKLDVAVLSIFPATRSAVLAPVVPINVLVPCTTSFALSKVGVEVPIRTDPNWFTVRNEKPDDDATVSGFTPEDPCMLNVDVEVVALTPATVPLSKKSPVESVEVDVKRARYPFMPPVRELEIPKDEVDTHCVDVPVDQRS
jgi:hypothetical protein